jgi:hypothetical protein
VADERRINVGITRARCALLIIGHAASLAIDARWRNLVASAVERDVVYCPTKPYNDYMQQVCVGGCGWCVLVTVEHSCPGTVLLQDLAHTPGQLQLHAPNSHTRCDDATPPHHAGCRWQAGHGNHHRPAQGEARWQAGLLQVDAG